MWIESFANRLPMDTKPLTRGPIVVMEGVMEGTQARMWSSYTHRTFSYVTHTARRIAYYLHTTKIFLFACCRFPSTQPESWRLKLIKT